MPSHQRLAVEKVYESDTKTSYKVAGGTVPHPVTVRWSKVAEVLACLHCPTSRQCPHVHAVEAYLATQATQEIV